MAVFLINACKFGACGLNFGTLGELIQHIEESHIEFDLKEKTEVKQPSSIALSRVLRFYGEGTTPKKIQTVKKSRQRNNSVLSSSASIRSLTPTSSEYDYEEEEGLDAYGGGMDSDDSRDSWTAQQEFTSQLILNMMNNKNETYDKPYCCPLKGCKKRYKNINGVKYHARHGHKREAKLAKMQKCFCGKAFHSMKQLEQHTASEHRLTSASTPTSTASTSSDQLTQAADLVIQPSAEPGLSIVRPITITGGVVLSPSQARQVKVNSKTDIVVAQNVSQTKQPAKMASVVSLSNEELEKQQQINATVARALAAAKQAMAAAASGK